jgi:Uma2 family endonuclease
MATTISAPAPATLPACGFKPHRLTVDCYHRMIAAGIFSEKEPIFLWKGQLVEKMPKGQPHNIALNELFKALIRLVPEGWNGRQEQPILLTDDSEPEPDITIVRGSSRDYPDRPPAASDVVLLVKVSDSSLPVDSGEVLEINARESIPIYWIVNIPKRRIEVYRRPEGNRYAEQQLYGPEDEVPVVLDGREVGRIRVRDVLP